MINGPELPFFEGGELPTPEKPAIQFSLENSRRAPYALWRKFLVHPHFLVLNNPKGDPIDDPVVLDRNNDVQEIMRLFAQNDNSETRQTIFGALDSVASGEPRPQDVQFINSKLLEYMTVKHRPGQDEFLELHEKIDGFLRENDLVVGTGLSLNGRKVDFVGDKAFALVSQPPRNPEVVILTTPIAHRVVKHEGEEITMLVKKSQDPGEVFHILGDMDHFAQARTSAAIKTMQLLSAARDMNFDEYWEGIDEVTQILNGVMGSRKELINWLREDERTLPMLEGALKAYLHDENELIGSIKRVIEDVVGEQKTKIIMQTVREKLF